MKKLNEIKEAKQKKIDELLKRCLVFFAFSNEQFAESKTPLKEGEKYVRMGMGGFIPSGMVKEFNAGWKEVEAWYKAEIKANKARKANIAYELSNHEAYLTGDIEDTLEALGEDYTHEEVAEVFHKEMKKHIND